MTKPNTVPAAAQWITAYNQWDLGEYNATGVKTGIWQSWHVEGQLCDTLDYKEGHPPFIFKRFHPDGTIAQEGNWYGNDTWLGTYRWIRIEHPTPEPFPAGAPNVWIVEFDYEKERIYHAQRFYDKEHQPVTATGTPMPERPANVPRRAHYSDNSGRWIMGQVDTRMGRYTAPLCRVTADPNPFAAFPVRGDVTAQDP